MFLIRPVKPQDLESLFQFSESTALGMISLPRNKEWLKKKIDSSLEAFSSSKTKPDEVIYFFMLENILTGEKGGCSGIYAKTGVSSPMHFFRLEEEPHTATRLPVRKDIRVLKPVALENGPSELCALFLKQRLRKEKLGELLSLCRLLFVAEHRERFEATIMARLRGFINTAKNTSPFWEGYGKHFLQLSFKEVMELQQGGHPFIHEFLPRHPLYISFLPTAARNVIQKTHPSTKPALKMLENEGFTLTDLIDPIDSGPIVSAPAAEIRSIRESVKAVFKQARKELPPSKKYVISNTKLDFRACFGRLILNPDQTVELTSETAGALEITPGDTVRFIATHHH